MSLFRCEEMALYQLFLQSEAAYNCVGEVGEIGLVQFRDMNPEVNAFQRKFVNEVRRCDEMERKLRFIEKEVKKEAHIKIPASLPPEQNRQVPASREMNELDNQLEKLENELRELLSNQEQLQKNFLELTELKQVLLRTSTFFQEADSHRFVPASKSGADDEEGDALLDPESGAGSEAHQSGGALKLGVVAGVIKRELLGAFERVLWRVCRGNVFLKHADIEEPLIDPTTGDSLRKCVFIVFFQGEQLGNRVKKICEGFRATLYPCPEDTAQRRETLKGVEARIADLQTVLDQTLSHRARVLESAAANLPQWFCKVRKIKSIYHTLNLFQVSQKYLQVQCWIPVTDIPKIQAALDKGTSDAGSSVPSVLTQIPTKEQPPTFNRTNKFTEGFQTIIDAYGVASYREMNPMPFTVISFPFLFAVMFGDCGHGLIMALFAGLLIWKEKQIIAAKSKNEIFSMFFGGRYVIFLMGLFSVYTGLLYNDLFSKSMNIFGSQWGIPADVADKLKTLSKDDTVQLYPESSFGDNSPYPFGMDPIWQVAENKLDFLNSFKMKLSVILGVMHMMFGVFLSFLNHTYFHKPVNIIGEFIPQVLFLGGLFGYLVFMIFYKWFAFDHTNSYRAPQLLITFTNMFMFGKPDDDLYTGQYTVQCILLVIGVACVPWMLLFKPIVMYIQHKNPAAATANNLLCLDWSVAPAYKRAKRSSMNSDTVTSENSLYEQRSASQPQQGCSTDALTQTKRNSALGNGFTFKNLNNLSNEDAEGAQGLISNDELANESEEPQVISSDVHSSNGAAGGSGAGAGGGGHGGHDDGEEFDFGQIMILQAIHTIEFCLGCISHTASYLRLWALSLAHAELSEVLWTMVMNVGLASSNFLGAVLVAPVFAAWAVLTIAILLLMEGLSAFLHALRLHWVEFQSKFYHGEGHLFTPFSFQHIVDNPLEE
ncbi:V-type proton ATPase 116 kDa subunit a 1-like isoform X3 [Convolutriloba macropyga]|uniref:V-type proton ATPase 116 kDa subunit a 1-like isoform X3 n=1 Tax=Convolutriloba macropyga TaxID=536237 RepID=UPI003F52164C